MTNWKTYRFAGRPWQDWIFAAGGTVFTLALIPMLLDGTDVPPLTGLSTALFLYGFSVAYASYGVWMGAGVTVASATAWLILGLGVV